MSKVPTNAEYMQLAREWKAAKTIAEKNSIATIILQGLDKLIHRIVRRYAHKFDEAMHEDCYAEAQLSVIKSALPNFNEDKMGDCKFTSYVSSWISQAAKRNIDKTASTVVFPINGKQAAIKAMENGEELSVKQLSYLADTVYWDKNLGPDSSKSGSTSLADIICANEGVYDKMNVVDHIQKRHEEMLCKVLLDEPVHKRSAYIVRERLNGRTFVEMADELGMSKSNVARLYKEHIDRLRDRVSLASAVKSKDGRYSQTSAETRIDVLIELNEKLKLEERGDTRNSTRYLLS